MRRQCNGCFKIGHSKWACTETKKNWRGYVTRLADSGKFRKEMFGSWIRERTPGTRRRRRFKKAPKQSGEASKDDHPLQCYERRKTEAKRQTSWKESKPWQRHKPWKKCKSRETYQSGETCQPRETKYPRKIWKQPREVLRPRKQEPSGKKEERRINSEIYWWYVAGGLNAKFDSVKNIINKESPVAFFILEANLNRNKCHKHLYLPGYDLFVSESDMARTACYIKKGSGYKMTNAGEGNEVISIENSRNKVLGVYRPFKLYPGQTLKGNFDTMLKHLEKETITPKEIIVGGDFNIDWMSDRDKAMKRDLELWSLNNGLCQLIDVVTRRRITETRTEESTIDHLYTSNNSLAFKVIENPMSDHHIISCSIESWTPTTTKVVRRDWRKYSENSIMHYVSTEKGKRAMDILMRDSSNTSDELVDKLNKFLVEFINIYAPYRVNKTRRVHDIVDSSITAIKKKRDRALKRFLQTKSNQDHSMVKELTKELKRKVKTTIRDKYQKKACTGNQKRLLECDK